MSFDPTSVTSANLKVWCKGDAGVYKDAGTTTCANGDKVQQWNDQSGNGKNLTQTATANQPTFTSSAINSLGAIQWIPTASTFFNIPDIGMATATAGEIFLLFKNDTATPGNQTAAGNWVFSNSDQNCHLPWTDGVIYEAWGSTVRKTIGNPGTALGTTARLYNVYSAPSDYAVFLNASSLFTGNSNTVTFRSTGSKIGQSDSNLYNKQGIIAEFCVFDNKLSDTDRGQLSDYFGITRYNLWSASAGRLTALTQQVLVLPNPNARLTQLVMSILIPTTPPSSGRGQLGRL